LTIFKFLKSETKIKMQSELPKIQLITVIATKLISKLVCKHEVYKNVRIQKTR